MIRESVVEKYLTRKVKESGGVSIKLPANLYKGIPDRMLLFPGRRVWFVELKRSEKETLSPMQIHWLRILKKLGFNSVPILGKDQVDQLMKDIKSEVSEDGV